MPNEPLIHRRPLFGERPAPVKPSGPQPIRLTAVLFKRWLNILGTPPNEERDDLDEERDHNCDAMGCGSVGPHILARIELTPEQLFALRQEIDDAE